MGQLDEVVWEDLCEVIRHPELIALELERAWGGQWLPEELRARRVSLRRARASLEQQLERLTAAYLDGARMEAASCECYRRVRADIYRLLAA